MDRRWALVVAVLGSTMAFLDGTVVNVALPVMQQSLAATAAEMQWIVEAYLLLLATLVLVGGALGDRLGRRRVFVAGVVIFALASAACGAAPGATTLIVARGVQGVGGALLVPGSLSLISAAYPEDTRPRAIGIWSAASAVTTSIGPVLGGWVVAHASFRWIFFFNAPLGAIVTVLALRCVEETRDETAPPNVDVLGATLAATGLGAVVFTLLDAPSPHDLARPRAIATLAAGVAVLVAFVVVEARRTYAMVPLSLFRSRAFTGTNLLTLFLYAGLGGGLFFLPFDLVQVHGYSPTAAGASLLPLVVLLSVMSPAAGAIVKRFGPRLPLVVGPIVASGGFALLALPGTSGAYLSTFFPGVMVLGLGLGVTVAPLTATVMGSVETNHAGVASGVNNAVARAAGLLAVAGLGVVVVARFGGVLDDAMNAMHASAEARAAVDAQRARLAGADLSAVPLPERDAVRRAFDDAYVAGFRAAMLACSALAAAGALSAALLVDRGRRAAR